MTIYTMPQRSEAWHEIRKGKFTASDFGDLMPAKSKAVDSWNKTQLDIVHRVAAERMTGLTSDGGYISAAMQWGIDTEDEARFAYEFATGKQVLQVGFIELDEWLGCSPDGLIDDDGGLELKCPTSAVHLSYLHDPVILAEDYKWQCIGSLLVSDRDYWELVSYDPRFPEDKQLARAIFGRDKVQPELDLLRNRLDLAILKVKEIIGG
jgi:hypothetical protein